MLLDIYLLQFHSESARSQELCERDQLHNLSSISSRKPEATFDRLRVEVVTLPC